MAYKKVSDESSEAAAERSTISAGTAVSGAVRNDRVERAPVMFEGRQHGTVEIPTIDHAAMGRPVDKQYERNLASVKSRLKLVGVFSATVINFLPMMLMSNSYIDTLRKARIKPAKDGQEYSVFFIGKEEIIPTRMGADSPTLAFDVHPIQLADEFVKVYGGLGGVIAFIGRPEDIGTPEWNSTISPTDESKTLGEMFEEQRMRAILWMRQQLSNGNNKKAMGQNVNILSYEKDAARRLLYLGDITELPSWVEEQRDLNIKRHSCQKCQKPVEPGIAQCLTPNCGFIVNPRLAYEIGAIAEDHIALERLTRDEVIEMGISDYVAETVDEKPARLATQDPKPLSLSAFRIKQVEEDYQQAQRKTAAKENATLMAAAMSQKTDSKAKTDKE